MILVFDDTDCFVCPLAQDVRGDFFRAIAYLARSWCDFLDRIERCKACPLSCLLKYLPRYSNTAIIYTLDIVCELFELVHLLKGLKKHEDVIFSPFPCRACAQLDQLMCKHPQEKLLSELVRHDDCFDLVEHTRREYLAGHEITTIILRRREKGFSDLAKSTGCFLRLFGGCLTRCEWLKDTEGGA